MSFDITFNEDLIFSNGDFLIEESTGQEVSFILEANKGHFYQFPEIGANAKLMINSNNTKIYIVKIIIQELEKDGLENININLNAESNEQFITAVRREV